MADMTAITALGAARSRPECGLCGRQRARARPAGAAQDGKHQRKWEARRRARTAEQPPAAASGSSKNRQPQLLVCMYTGNGRGKRRCACRISLRSTAGGFPGAPPLPKGGNHSREGKAQLPFECKSKTHVTSKARSPRWRRRRHVALPSGTDISLCVCVCVCYAYGMLSFVVHTAQLRVRHIPHKADVSPMTCDVNMADLWAYWKRIFLAWVEGG